ncbi:MAG: hypothetical protein KJO31_03715 [Gammaproteobacteria bacterium]|nr:hypothetical protein [Gammaproteobacteria bacterium]
MPQFLQPIADAILKFLVEKAPPWWVVVVLLTIIVGQVVVRLTSFMIETRRRSRARKNDLKEKIATLRDNCEMTFDQIDDLRARVSRYANRLSDIEIANQKHPDVVYLATARRHYLEGLQQLDDYRQRVAEFATYDGTHDEYLAARSLYKTVSRLKDKGDTAYSASVSAENALRGNDLYV